MQEGGVAFRARLANRNLAALVGAMVVHEAVEAEAKTAQVCDAIVHVRDRRQDAAFLRIMAMPTNGTLGLLLLWRRLDETFGI